MRYRCLCVWRKTAESQRYTGRNHKALLRRATSVQLSDRPPTPPRGNNENTLSSCPCRIGNLLCCRRPSPNKKNQRPVSRTDSSLTRTLKKVTRHGTTTMPP